MRRTALLLTAIVAGCQRPATPVYVDLAAVPAEAQTVATRTGIRAAGPPTLPAASGTLQGLQGAQLALSETTGRIREARKLIEENRQAALKSLTSALYRSYSRQADADRSLREQDMEKSSEALWDLAFLRISDELKDHARIRVPLANRLALLVGFPTPNPALRPKPENRFDAKRYDEAVAAWEKLLAADKQFAAEAQRILDRVQEQIDAQRVQIQIDFSKALNVAADRSKAEAESAVASRLPDFVGGLSQRPDVSLPPEPPRHVQLPAIPGPRLAPVENPAKPRDLSREYLAQDLRIWLAQNGYVLAESPLAAPDRTKEFVAWIQKRRAGL